MLAKDNTILEWLNIVISYNKTYKHKDKHVIKKNYKINTSILMVGSYFRSSSV